MTSKKTKKTKTDSTSTIGDFELVGRFYSKEEFKEYVLNLECKAVRTNRKIEYLNIPCEIDIEVSSFRDTAGEKVGLMYCFTFGINGRSYLGRTKEDLLEIMSFVIDTFGLSSERRIVISINTHLMLFQFIPAEDDNFCRMVFFQHDLNKFLAKRTGPAGHQYDLIIPIHTIPEPFNSAFS